MDLNELDIENLAHEDVLLREFADHHLNDAMRILTSKQITVFDKELIYNAIAVLLVIYSKKLREGKIDNSNKVYH